VTAARLIAAWLAVVAAGGCARAAADEPEVTLRVAGEVTVAVGAVAALSVTVTPAPGRTVSADGPLRLEVVAGDGLVVGRRRHGRRDAADPAADAPRFDVRVRGRAAGDHALTLAARLWLCGPRMCRPVRLERTVTVHVEAPPVDAGVDAPVDAGPVDAGPRRRRR
jgi:hypothetical protein